MNDLDVKYVLEEMLGLIGQLPIFGSPKDTEALENRYLKLKEYLANIKEGE